MSPKEKAKEMTHFYLKELLSGKYSINGFVINDLAKQCALLEADDKLNVFGILVEDKTHICYHIITQYYQEVKMEIEKL